MTNPYWEENPWFWNEIKERKEQGGFIFIAATGLPNFGKTYWCMAVAEDLQTDWGLPRIRDAECIVFNAKQFRTRMENCPEWEITIWDEPNKGLSHRNWYLEMNKEVTAYIQTSRWKHKPLFLALPHIRLLDKSARAVLIGEAMMKRPGLTRVHQLEPDYYGNREFFKYFRGEVLEYLPNHKFQVAYEEKRAEFHKTDFPEEAFEEEPEKNRTRSWELILEKILSDPNHKLPNGEYAYKREIGKSTGQYIFTARKIRLFFSCSDITAQKVVDHIPMDTGNS
jgi:hypothetical protein